MNKHNCKAKFEIGQKFIFKSLSTFMTEVVSVVYTENEVFYDLDGWGIVAERYIVNSPYFQLVLDVQTKGE